jgi:prefoldin, archaeal alpha subunit/eukaryotic subunit 5
MENQQNENNLRQELEFLESYVSSTDKQIQMMSRGLDEFSKAMAVLESDEIPQSSETMIALGGGLFMRGTLDKSKNILVAIGSDVYIEEGGDMALERLKAQVTDVQNGLSTLNAQRMEAIRRYDSLVGSLSKNRE